VSFLKPHLAKPNNQSPPRSAFTLVGNVRPSPTISELILFLFHVSDFGDAGVIISP